MSADDSLTWKQTVTEHFVFIYQQKNLQAVKELVGFCEDVYKEVTGFFGSYPRQIICVLFGNTDIANGYYTFPPHHIGLYVSSPISPWLGAGYENWLRILLVHELTHYVHLRYEAGLFKNLSYIFGEGVIGGDALFLPGWMIEGITTNTETIFSKGGRGRNPFFEIYYKAPLLEDHFFTLDQAEYSSAFPPPGRIYVAGYIFIHFLREKYGEDVFRKINEKFAAQPLFGPWQAIKEVTGHDAVELYAQMKQELEQRYAHDRQLPGGEMVTPEKFGDYTLPVITRKGWILYRRDLDSSPALVRFDPDTKREEVLVRARLADDYSFSADAGGDKIVYAGVEVTQRFRQIDSAVVYDLYLYNAPTGRVVRLTTNAHLYHPALSADGRKLVAAQRVGSCSRLVEVDPATGSCRLLFAEPGSSVFNPVFSPDGKHIAFVLQRQGLRDIYLLDYPLPTRAMEGEEKSLLRSYNNDKKRVVLGPDNAGEYYPRFGDNDTLLFSSDRGGSLALYAYRLSARSLTLVCRDRVAAFAGQMVDGDLLYASYSWRGFCIKRMPGRDLLNQPVALPAAQAVPPKREWGEVKSTAYCDLPLFQFWLPYPNVTLLSPQRFLLGGGIYVLGASPLQTTSYSAALSFYPAVMQPIGTLSLSTALGITDISYYLDLDYSSDTSGYYRQTMTHTLLLSVPLLGSVSDDVSSRIVFSGGLGYSYRLYSVRSFGFFNGFSDAGLTDENELDFLSVVSFSFSQSGGILDFYAPLSVTGSILVQVPLPVFPESVTGFHTVGRLELNLPFFIPHLVLKLGTKASYTTEELLGYPVIRPRGLFDTEPQSTTGRALFSADLLFPLALPDQPLGGGFHLDGIGAGLHVEMLADFNIDTRYFNPERYLYLGGELTLTIGLGMVSMPVGVGVSFRLDTSDIASFDPGQDIRPYIFLGFDSFLSAVTVKK